MRRVSILLAVLTAVVCLFSGCKSASRSNDAIARLEKLNDLKLEVAASEQAFIQVLDSVNDLRVGMTEYHDSIHSEAMGVLTIAYDNHLQALYNTLGKSAALANAGTDEATDAFSEYLLDLRGLTESKYAEMVRLTSLSLDQYGQPEFEAYTLLLQQVTAERQSLEDTLEASFKKYASDNKIEYESSTPSAE